MNRLVPAVKLFPATSMLTFSTYKFKCSRNFYNCHDVPPPSTTIKNREEERKRKEERKEGRKKEGKKERERERKKETALQGIGDSCL
jgi:hypothetical protein